MMRSPAHRFRRDRRFQEEVGPLLSRLTRDGSFHEQTIFWAPEALPTVVPLSQALPSSPGKSLKP